MAVWVRRLVAVFVLMLSTLARATSELSPFFCDAITMGSVARLSPEKLIEELKKIYEHAGLSSEELNALAESRNVFSLPTSTNTHKAVRAQAQMFLRRIESKAQALPNFDAKLRVALQSWSAQAAAGKQSKARNEEKQAIAQMTAREFPGKHVEFLSSSGLVLVDGSGHQGSVEVWDTQHMFRPGAKPLLEFETSLKARWYFSDNLLFLDEGSNKIAAYQINRAAKTSNFLGDIPGRFIAFKEGEDGYFAVHRDFHKIHIYTLKQLSSHSPGMPLQPTWQKDFGTHTQIDESWVSKDKNYLATVEGYYPPIQRIFSLTAEGARELEVGALEVSHKNAKLLRLPTASGDAHLALDAKSRALYRLFPKSEGRAPQRLSIEFTEESFASMKLEDFLLHAKDEWAFGHAIPTTQKVGIYSLYDFLKQKEPVDPLTLKAIGHYAAQPVANSQGRFLFTLENDGAARLYERDIPNDKWVLRDEGAPFSTISPNGQMLTMPDALVSRDGSLLALTIADAEKVTIKLYDISPGALPFAQQSNVFEAPLALPSLAWRGNYLVLLKEPDIKHLVKVERKAGGGLSLSAFEWPQEIGLPAERRDISEGDPTYFKIQNTIYRNPPQSAPWVFK